MVENTEDEKIREDSNEGLDSSGGGDCGVDYATTTAAAAVVVPTDATDATVVVRTATETAALLPKWRRQHSSLLPTAGYFT